MASDASNRASMYNISRKQQTEGEKDCPRLVRRCKTCVSHVIGTRDRTVKGHQAWEAPLLLLYSGGCEFPTKFVYS